jgi:hypothetical protein
MKILVFSDIYAWSGYEKVVDRIKPDVLVLAGDLMRARSIMPIYLDAISGPRMPCQGSSLSLYLLTPSGSLNWII